MILLNTGQRIQVNQIKWNDVASDHSYDHLDAVIQQFSVYRLDPLKPATMIEGGEQLIALAMCKTKVKIYVPALGINIKDNYGKIIINLNSYFLSQKQLSKPIEADARFIVYMLFTFPKVKNEIYAVDVAISDYHSEQSDHLDF